MTPYDLFTTLDRWTRRADLLSDEIYDFESDNSLLVPREIPREIWDDIGCALSCMDDALSHLRKAVVTARGRARNG